jgi:hypothetical protein
MNISCGDIIIQIEGVLSNISIFDHFFLKDYYFLNILIEEQACIEVVYL